MSKDFHNKWLCRGECELSGRLYDDELRFLVEKLANQTNRTFGPPSSIPFKKAILSRYSLPPGNRCLLVDKELHGNFWLDLNETESTSQLYQSILPTVLVELQKSEIKKFEPILEVYLWCAVNVQDLATMEATIVKFKELIPPCILASLLSQAIYSAFEEGADALLKFGASPEHNNSRGPLNDVFLAFMRNSNSSDVSSQQSKNHFRRLTSIMKKLIEHGATLLFGDRRVICNQRLHWVSNLAVADANAVRVLLEAMPSMAFRIPRALIIPGVDYDNDDDTDSSDFGGPLSSTCSALASTIYRAAQSYSDPRNPPTNWIRILAYGTLPLLRAGAVCDPDPLERRRVNVALARLIQPSPEKDRVITRYWGRPQAVVDIVLEARRKCSLDVDLLRHCLTSQVTTMTPPTEAELVKSFTEVFRSHFPRNLQKSCRETILNKFPCGARQRFDAIEQLDLPTSLKRFLNYDDLNVLSGTLND